MQFIGEVRNVKTAKEPRCLQVFFVTNELTEEEAGKLVHLKDEIVKVTLEAIPQKDEF